MINTLLALGTVALMSTPVKSADLTSFINDLSQVRLELVKAYAHYIRSFSRMTVDQKEYLLSLPASDESHAQAVNALPASIMSINRAIIEAGGQTMTKDQFKKLIDEEMNGI